MSMCVSVGCYRSLKIVRDKSNNDNEYDEPRGKSDKEPLTAERNRNRLEVGPLTAKEQIVRSFLTY